MPRLQLICSLLAALVLAACQSAPAPAERDVSKKDIDAIYGTPVLDGSGSDELWERAEWFFINQAWQGKQPDTTDFNGRFKVAWDENNIYILAEITDDRLVDIYEETPVGYWDDDGLILFVDEDASGGNHLYSYNAFAYNIDVNGKVTDMAPDSSFRFFNDHCLVLRVQKDQTSTWEIVLRVFDGNKYQDGEENVPKLLRQNKKLGFALAYNDNDRSPACENTLGSVQISGDNYRAPWEDASFLGSLTLR